MGLMRALRRCRYVYGWRLRYWWMDTDGGAEARIALCVVAGLVVVLQFARLGVVAHDTLTAPAPQAQHAVYWWVIQLIILVISAIISYALRPKVEPPKPAETNPPSVEDGQMVVDVLGTCWVPDTFLLAWKPMGVVPIKSSGGKK